MFTREFFTSVISTTPVSFPEITRIWTDSRTIQKGDLFVAIPGEKFDGHEYVSSAIGMGAAAAMVLQSKDFPGRKELQENGKLLEVSSPIEGLRSLAKAYRRQLKCPVFVVAGSNGKTTTKEWVAHLLASQTSRPKVFKTQKSQNSILGIALSLLQIRDEAYAVIEVGIDEPGWMDQHLEVVDPTLGLITTISEEHLERLKNMETVAREELKLYHFLESRGRGFAANLDSPWIREAVKSSCSYSLDFSGAGIEGRYIAPNVLHAFGLEWKSPLPGKHNAQNLLAALAAFQLLHPEATIEDYRALQKSTASFEGEAHRSRWLELADGIRVFDDCYNANPDSMERSLQTFLELSEGSSRRVILGDMLDLGDASEEAHARILNLALVLGFESIFLFGPRFSAAVAAAKVSADDRFRIHTFDKVEQLIEAIRKMRQPRDSYLLKGSRGMALERVLPILGGQSPVTQSQNKSTPGL